MESKGSKQSKIDKCVFYCKSTTILQYIDDLIIFNKDDNNIKRAINDLKERFDLEDMGNVTNFLGVKVEKVDNKITLTQPKLIHSILNDLSLLQNNKVNSLTALTLRLLHPELE